MSRTLTCATHGAEEWQGHVICAVDARGCGRVYQTHDSAAPHYAPRKCPCGQRLMSTGKGDFVKRSTARAICSKCFELKLASQEAT